MIHAVVLVVRYGFVMVTDNDGDEGLAPAQHHPQALGLDGGRDKVTQARALLDNEASDGGCKGVVRVEGE